MKITTPIKSVEEIAPLAKAGADEFYCGALTSWWKKKYGYLASPNRRYFEQSQVKSFKEIEVISEECRKKKKILYYTLNSPYYTKEQLKELEKEIRKLAEYKVNGIIISDLSLLLWLNKKENKDLLNTFKICISTCASVYNSESAKFYSGLGAKKIVLPRHIKIEEIEPIVQKNKNNEFECFVANDLCRNEDGFCGYQHGTEDILGVDHICNLYNQFEVIGASKDKARIINQRLRNLPLGFFFAVKDIPKLKNAGVSHLKISGRRFPTKEKAKVVSLVKELTKISSKKDYQEKAEELFENSFGFSLPKNSSFY
ncbi:peptidase U32 family protein [Nanoarchaeota archaeon]